MITDLDHGEGARMLERARAVLIDFNVARTFDINDEPMATCTGTPAFRSPEIMHGWEYDQSVDIWGLGAIVYASAGLAFQIWSNANSKFRKFDSKFPELKISRYSQFFKCRLHLLYFLENLLEDLD